MVGPSDILRQLGIGQWRAIKLAFNQHVGSARTIETPAQLLLVPGRLERKFKPRRFLGARGIIHDSEIQSSAEHAGNTYRLMLAISEALLQKTKRIVSCLCWG
jgi:hypothetical protein